MIDVFKEGLLVGKTAFVTGGTSGINLCIAETFARHGAKVAVVGRNADKATAAEAQIRAASRHGGDAFSTTCDVRDYAALERAIVAAKARFGAIDILVNGAAGNFPAPALGMSANGFKSVVDIDLLGTFNACRAAFEHLNKPGASILSLSATQASHPSALQAHVCAAKAGVDMITRTLALEWGPLGVRINSIAPGPIDDTEGMRRLAPTDEARAKLVDQVPLRRYGTKDEMAALALFLCSPAAHYITGAVLVADGGQCLNGFGGFTSMFG
jgi:NAD(P)-dependent dehydrogenase (short-subunit alcohol dehydrogenase family)